MALADHVEHRLDAREILGQRASADLHLDRAIAEIAIMLHLVAQLLEALAGIVIAACGIDPGMGIGAAAIVALGQKLPERHALGLGAEIPERHVDHADRHRALAMAARLLVGHHHGPAFRRLDQAALVDQRFGPCRGEARDEALAHQALRRVAPVGIEAEPHHRRVAAEIGRDGDDARRHLAEIDVGVADRRIDRRDHVADGGDAHGRSVSPAG